MTTNKLYFEILKLFVKLYNKTHILDRNTDRVELIHASHVCKI